MPGALPILLASGAALALMSKKKKRRAKARAGQSCDMLEASPAGYFCDEGLLRTEPVGEEDLEKEEELSGDAMGDFETKDEDVFLIEGEEAGTLPIPEEPPGDPSALCEEFLRAIHIVVTEPGDLPINKIAVEQTAIPAMEAALTSIVENVESPAPIDPERAGPAMVRQALAELIPVCEWKYDESNDQFVYNDTRTIDSEIGQEVLYGLMNLSVRMIDGFNQSNLVTPGFDPAKPPTPNGFQN